MFHICKTRRKNRHRISRSGLPDGVPYISEYGGCETFVKQANHQTIMDLLYVNEHLNCLNYEKNKPMIEPAKIVKGQKVECAATTNEVLFVTEGRMEYLFRDTPRRKLQKGQVIFIRSGCGYSYQALTDASIILFRISDPVTLCSNFTVEKLYRESIECAKNADGEGIGAAVNGYEPVTRQYGCLEVNARMWHFLDGMSDCIGDGLKCRCWFEMKVKEFFLLVRAYYPKEEVRDFLYPILSLDTAFSEHVRRHWRDFRTVSELAAFMHMTPKRFSSRFNAVFGTTPYRWMTEGRARIVHREITSTGKLFKQIAWENGFTSDSLFTRFCRTEFGKTPSELRGSGGTDIL